MFTVFERLKPPSAAENVRKRTGSEELKRSLSSEQLLSVGIVEFEDQNDKVTGTYDDTMTSRNDKYRAISVSSDESDRVRYEEAKLAKRNKAPSSFFRWPKLFQNTNKPTTNNSPHGSPRPGRRRFVLTEINYPIKNRESRSQSLASTVSRSSLECEPDDDEEEDGEEEVEEEVEECDPITLGPFDKTTYEYITPCGRTIKYSVSSLVEYIHKTGELTDPVSRNEFSEADLRNIDKITSNSTLPEIHSLPSVLAVLSNREHYTKMAQACSTILGLEACLGEIIVEVLAQIESVPPIGTSGRAALPSYYYNKAEMNIHCLLLSGFDVPFAELKSLSIERAYQAHKNWAVFLRGPRKKPTADNFGILTLAIRTLNCHWSHDDQVCLEEFRRNSASSRLSACSSSSSSNDAGTGIEMW